MLQVFFRRGDFPSGSWEAAAALGPVTGDARPAHVVTTALGYRHPSLHKSAFTSHFRQNACARPPGSPLLWFCSSSAASHSCISNVMQNTLRCTLIIHGLVSRQSRFLFFNCSLSGTGTSADSPPCFVVLLCRVFGSVYEFAQRAESCVSLVAPLSLSPTSEQQKYYCVMTL